MTKKKAVKKITAKKITTKKIAVKKIAVKKVATKKILFVCTGNTCRSPMAQVMAAHLFGPGYEIISAGLMAMPNSAASAHAVAVMKERQLNLTGHKAQPVTEILVKESDLILAMTPSHKTAISKLTVANVWTLTEYANADENAVDGDTGRNKDGGESGIEVPGNRIFDAEPPVSGVSDPFGGDIEVYRKCAGEIYCLLEKVLARICREDNFE